MIAVSPNSNEVHIYESKGEEGSQWGKPKYILKEHLGFIADIDWCAETNSIVTCGHDRNAFVWEYDSKEDKWEHVLVILRVQRAATACKWSPNGKKIAVGSGSKTVPICNYDKENHWWRGNMIKKHKSTILDIDWSPNSKFIVTGACDKKCRVVSAYVEEAGDTSEDDGFGAIWEKQNSFGEVLAEFDMAKAWVNAVSWAPSGQRLAFAGQGSTMHFIQLVAGSKPEVQTVCTKELPYTQITFLSDDTLAATGFDLNPVIYQNGGGDKPDWSLKEKMDKETDVEKKKSGGGKAFGSAFNKFRNQDSFGSGSQSVPVDVPIKTLHKNNITSLKILPTDKKKFSTSGLDGRILFWDATSLIK